MVPQTRQARPRRRDCPGQLAKCGCRTGLKVFFEVALRGPFYLVGGCVVAFHFDQVHAWVCAHARLVVALTAAAAPAAEGIYFLAAHGVITAPGSGSDPFQPSVIPLNVGPVTCGYLAGAALVQPGRSR